MTPNLSRSLAMVDAWRAKHEGMTPVMIPAEDDGDRGERAAERFLASVADSRPREPGSKDAGDKEAKHSFLPSIAPPAPAEIEAFRLAPRCLVPDLLYADVRLRVAAGGVGKTTLALFEAAALALEWPLWGSQPAAPLRTLILTREDGREILLARLREVVRAMGDETGDGLARVLDRVRIMDLSAIPFRLALVADDVVLPSVANIDALVDHLGRENFRPDWIICDPAVSLGVGEARVNDGEQGLIEAARILRNRLDCCVEFIHHVGKGNARERNSDQYGYRGGSAFADGARMVAVLNPVTPEEWLRETGTPLLPGETALVMALPKMSYAQPRPPVFIIRDGWHFSQRVAINADPERDREAIANQVAQFILGHAEQGRTLSGRELEDLRGDMRLSRDAVRAAVTRLRVSGRVREAGEQGKRRWLELADPRGNPAATVAEK